MRKTQSGANAYTLKLLSDLSRATKQSVGLGGLRQYTAVTTSDCTLVLLRREDFQLLFHKGVIGTLQRQVLTETARTELLDQEKERRRLFYRSRSMASDCFGQRYRMVVEVQEKAESSKLSAPGVKESSSPSPRREVHQTLQEMWSRLPPEVEGVGSLLPSFAPPQLLMSPIRAVRDSPSRRRVLGEGTKGLGGSASASGLLLSPGASASPSHVLVSPGPSLWLGEDASTPRSLPGVEAMAPGVTGASGATLAPGLGSPGGGRPIRRGPVALDRLVALPRPMPASR